MGERACAPISTDDPWRGLCGISLGEGQGFRGLFLLNLHGGHKLDPDQQSCICGDIIAYCSGF